MTSEGRRYEWQWTCVEAKNSPNPNSIVFLENPWKAFKMSIVNWKYLTGQNVCHVLPDLCSSALVPPRRTLKTWGSNFCVVTKWKKLYQLNTLIIKSSWDVDIYLVQCDLDLVTTCDLVTILQRPFSIYYIKLFNVATMRFSDSFCRDQQCH